MHADETSVQCEPCLQVADGDLNVAGRNTERMGKKSKVENFFRSKVSERVE